MASTLGDHGPNLGDWGPLLGSEPAPVTPVYVRYFDGGLETAHIHDSTAAAKRHEGVLAGSSHEGSGP